ncbi:MAG: O-antigen ligase family protein [Bacteroidota bacterium]|nr:O-antigen ligase family protein [Bacteroidota bacterium]
MKLSSFKNIQIAQGHERIYIVALIMLVIALPFSFFLMSLSQIILLINWLSEGNFGEKLKILKDRKGILLICSIYLVHLLWLINTSDFAYAFHDLKIKLPLLVLPLIVGTSRSLNKNQVKIILQFFIAAVVAGTLLSTAILLGFSSLHVTDVRQISVFISHIRFSLLIIMAIFCLLWIAFSGQFNLNKSGRIFYPLAIFWLFVFLFLLQSFTGLFICMALCFVLFFRYWKNIKSLRLKIGICLAILISVCFSAGYIAHCLKKFYTIETISPASVKSYTGQGNPYSHDLNNKIVENGHYVWLNYCEKELRESWNQRSRLVYDGKDRKGQDIKYTLIRYLTSRGLDKDAKGVNALSEQDVRNIEWGMSNYIFQNKIGLYPKIYETIWQIDVFRKGGNPSGHSVTQRILYLSAAFHIIGENFWFGTGTGDVKAAFHTMYKKLDSPLTARWRLRAHNQFVTFFLSFGIFGFCWIMFAFIAPVILEKKSFDFLTFIFLFVAFASMLNEDTLETEAGMVFFAFFYSFFIFGRDKKTLACV